MRNAIGIFVATALAITLSWWWRGLPVAMPGEVLPAGGTLHCLSYAPFRGGQTPLDPTTVISPSQIEQDLSQLAKITGCVRIYSVDMGLERVPEIAARHNLQVLLGIWISSSAARNSEQVATGVALANRFPETIRAVIVGNEVLLRGEQSAQGLRAIIETVRNQTNARITYADVWEFWLQNRELTSAVDFVTVHILPYWEDMPIASSQAAEHIASIRARVASELRGKEVLIGEAGWPSRGRMREGARPSPVDQARVLHDLVALAHAQHFNVNLIEAYDQPWKRYLEGTVGGYWGLFDDAHVAKFAWGQPVSNMPLWRWHALGGVLLAAAIFALAIPRQRLSYAPAAHWAATAVVAACAGAFAGEAVHAGLTEGLGRIGWSRSALQIAVALLTPLAVAWAIGADARLPALHDIIGPRERRRRDRVSILLGICLIALCVVAIETALGLVFNARYLDFPTAALTSATLPLFVLSLTGHGRVADAPLAEKVLAALLVLSAARIVWVETLLNWQALWLAGAFLVLALTLARARAAPG